MPRISEFYGIVIAMYYEDHEPAHIHAMYGDYQAVIGINPAVMRRGQLPRRARAMVLEWVTMHETELSDNWGRARQHRGLLQIAPLD